MKKLLNLILFVLFTSFSIYSQVPEKLNYQAVVRSANGELIVTQSVDIQISIIDSIAGGDILYREIQTKTTNDFGVVNIVIGDGVSDMGDFSLIEWGVNSKFLKIEINIGAGLVDMGTVQLLSVPYALYASSAANLGDEKVYSTSTDTLFVVKDNTGNVVFAVFPDGAQVYVNELAKGKVGGFAVSGRNPNKAEEVDIFKVTPDSTRVFFNETVKGKVGGFAVSGRNPSKAGSSDYFSVSGENTPIIINPSKASVVWFPKKEAFWAGRVLIEHPDSVGLNSLAIGYEAVAKGSNSQSLGYQTRARGNFSTAIGFKTQANGVGCFAVGGEERGVDGTATGVNTIADGTASFALGLGSNASGIANTAIGLRSSATGNFASTAFGVFSSATANRATAIGFGSVASAEQALAIGVSDTASAYNSMAMGVGSRASGIAAIALGTFVEANTTGTFVVGQLNDPFGSNDLWNTSDPIFVVGNGIFGIPGVLSTALKSNALVILKNGNMGVGIDTPQRTVHIKDVMRLEPRLTAPLNPSEGDIYFDGVDKKLMVFDGTIWQACW
ncbi:MAG: hypothetical protein JEY96_16525 [Bacteroidales bacterium]|nr:hypothetical protein [Bacteroidales bacterium]